jgi:hypothetical protein
MVYWLFTYRNTIGVFLADALGLGLSLLKRMLVLELASHFDGVDDGGLLESARLRGEKVSVTGIGYCPKYRISKVCL